MMLLGEHEAPEAVSVHIPHEAPVEIKKELAESAAKILELSHVSAPKAAPARPVEPVKLDPLPSQSSLEDQELKIPPWLEPLPRNPAPPSSPQPLTAKRQPTHLTHPPPPPDYI